MTDKDESHADELTSNSQQQSLVLVRIVDARTPFPVLATYRLTAIPRPGDLIKIQVSNGVASYRVEFVNFDPFLPAQVALGCIAIGEQRITPADAKSRVDEMVRRQIQIFDKSQAYTNAVIAVGYAGAFGIWTFIRSQITPQATDVVALMLGASLVIFIIWEIFNMISRAAAQQLFFTRAKNPQEFLEKESEIAADEQRSAALYSKLWKIAFYPTIATGFGAIAILFYNVAADLLGLPKWP